GSDPHGHSLFGPLRPGLQRAPAGSNTADERVRLDFLHDHDFSRSARLSGIVHADFHPDHSEAGAAAVAAVPALSQRHTLLAFRRFRMGLCGALPVYRSERAMSMPSDLSVERPPRIPPARLWF